MNATTSTERSGLTRVSVLIAIGVFSTAFATHTRLAKLPLRALLMDDLEVSPEAMSAFFALAGLASYLRPVAGALSDRVPLWGTHRRHYVLLSAFAGATTWAVTGALPTTYAHLLAAMIVLQVAAVIGSTAVGGLLVDSGRVHDAAGRLSAIRVTASSTATLLAGPIGGWLAGVAFGWTCTIGAGLMLSLGAVVTLYLREVPVKRAPEAGIDGKRALLRSFHSPEYLAVVAITVVFYAMPGFGTPLYYFQKNTLALSDQTIGWLIALNCAGGVVGALFYAAIVRRFNLRFLLPAGICTYATCMLLYLAYGTWTAALVLEPLAGLLCTLAVLPFQHLAVRVSPARSGALGLALILGLGNAALALSDWLGALVMARFGIELSSLIWLSASSAAATLLLLPLVPATLLDAREGQEAGE